MSFTHDTWPKTPAAARALQQHLRSCVETDDRFGPIRRIAGVDIGYDKRAGLSRGAAVILDFPSLTLIEKAVVNTPTEFPYVPGLLSFREIPAAIAALEQLTIRPDVILCDAHGLAHPRRFGLACHLGVLRDIPTIGVAKSRLIGHFVDPPNVRGHRSPLVDESETIGAVLRSRVNVKPIFVSVGHRVSLTSAISITLQCLTRFRLPETTRHADKLASNRGKTRVAT